MTASAAVDVILGLGLLATAALALFLPKRSQGTVLFLVFGILLAVVWARLGAPDVALAEAILGAGVTGALVIDAATARPRSESGAVGRAPWAVPVAGGAAAGVVALILGWVAIVETVPAPGLGGRVGESLDETGVSHPVTAVLLNYRSYDTLLEVAVLAVAVLAALSLLADGTLPRHRPPPRVPEPLDALMRILTPMIILIAGWMLVAGSSRPGGAFQAGALLAGGLLLASLAGWPGLVPSRRWLRLALLVGLGGFVGVALVTVSVGTGWLVLPPEWAGAVILAIEAALTVSIGVTLATLFLAARSESLRPAGAPE